MHVVIAETNGIGLRGLAAAKKAGHYVSFIGSRNMESLVGHFDVLRDPALTDQVVIIDSIHDQTELLAAVTKIAAERPIDTLFTVVEACVEDVTRCAQTLGLKTTHPDAVALSQDKALCRQRIAQHGLASVDYQVVDSLNSARAAADRIGYPMIAKPKRGAMSLRVLKIENDADLARYFAEVEDSLEAPGGFVDAMSSETLLEHYVDGPLFSVEIAAAGGEIEPLILSWRKRCAENPAIELGTVMPAPVADSIRDEMFRYASAVVSACELNLGIFHIELIYGTDGPVLVEVNPRIMGGNIPAVFALATDIDPYAVLLDIHLNDQLPLTCRGIKPVCGAATRNLGPKVPGQLSEHFRTDWDAPFKSLLSAYSYRYTPGMSVSAMTSTMYPHHFQLTRPSAIEASLLAEWIIMTAADETGLSLRRSSEDYLLLSQDKE